MLTKVLPKSNVINNLRGRDNSLKTSLPLLPVLFSSFFRYTLDNENIAVSLPEKNADRARNRIRYNEYELANSAPQNLLSVIIFCVFHLIFVCLPDMVKTCNMQESMDQDKPKFLSECFKTLLF